VIVYPEILGVADLRLGSWRGQRAAGG